MAFLLAIHHCEGLVWRFAVGATGSGRCCTCRSARRGVMRAEPTPSHVGQLVKHDGTLSNCIRCSYRCGLSLSSGEWTAYWWRWWWRPALQSCSEFVILLLWKECPDSIPGIHLFICKTYVFDKLLVNIKHPHWFQESGAAFSFLVLSQRAFLLVFWAQEGGLLPTRHSAQCKHGPDGQTLRIFSIFRSNRCMSALFVFNYHSKWFTARLILLRLDPAASGSEIGHDVPRPMTVYTVRVELWWIIQEMVNTNILHVLPHCRILLLYDMEQIGRIPAVSCSFASLWILKIKILQFECEVVCRALLAVLLQISSAVWVPTMCADWGCYNLGSIL